MLPTLFRRHDGCLLATLLLLMVMTLAGCGGGNSETRAEPAPSAGMVIGAEGGTLTGPDGVTLAVPADALDAPLTITITRSATGAPALLNGQLPTVYAITPHGLQFRKPAVLTFPAAQLSGGSALQSNLLRAQPAGSWEVLDPPIEGAEGSASVLLDGLSFYGATSVDRAGPSRRTGVIQNSLSWAAPAPGVALSQNGLELATRRIVERTVVRVVISSRVDPWCGGTVTVKSTMLRQLFSNRFSGYELVQRQAQSAPVTSGSARAVFEYAVPVGASMAYYLFAGASACDNPQPLPPNAPIYGVLPHNQSLTLAAVAVAAPTITQQPVDTPAPPGDTVNFTVLATAPDALAIRWQRSDDGGATWVETGMQTGQISFVLLQAQATSLWRAKVCNVSATVSNCLDSNTVRSSALVVGAPWQADSLVAGSGTHSMAIGGAVPYVLSWGSNNGGALGRSSADPAPARVDGPAMRSVAAGGWYSIGLTQAGDVYAWGWGDNVGAAIGSTSLDNPMPRPVAGLTAVAGIATRYHHTLAVKYNGEVWGFGPEDSRALGPLQGHRGVRQIAGLAQMRQVAAGERHSLALAADGTVWSWGDNGAGQLGAGAAAVGSTRATPQRIAGLTDVVQIAAGANTSFALRVDGTVWSWGDAALLGRSGDASAPAQVQVPTRVSHIAAGHGTAWAISGGAAAFGWGDNSVGQVCSGSTDAVVSTPVRLKPTLAFRALAGGELHSLAVIFGTPTTQVCGFGGNDNLQLNGLPGPSADEPISNCVVFP